MARRGSAIGDLAFVLQPVLKPLHLIRAELLSLARLIQGLRCRHPPRIALRPPAVWAISAIGADVKHRAALLDSVVFRRRRSWVRAREVAGEVCPWCSAFCPCSKLALVHL